MKMARLLIPLALITLAACQDEREQAQGHNGITYSAECIDGVEYWVRASSGGRGFMAPRIDPETLTFVRCEEN